MSSVRLGNLPQLRLVLRIKITECCRQPGHYGGANSRVDRGSSAHEELQQKV